MQRHGREIDLSEASGTPHPFDVRTIRELIRLMARHDLSEIDLREGEQRIHLRRGGHSSVTAPAAGVHPVPDGSVPAPMAKPAPPEPRPNETASKKLIEIKSPTVGTFYAQEEPGAPPYVKVGSRVNPDTIVCIIEAMKVLNKIQAECSGVITEVLVNNKDFVEYGTVLFLVDPTG
jgi:acetyl-CoA carboxylase biotin carboxyl carrier protein